MNEFYSFFNISYDIAAIVLFNLAILAAVLFGRVSSRISFRGKPLHILVAVLSVVGLAAVTIFCAVILVAQGIQSGVGNPRPEVFLKEGHEYYVFGACDTRIAGPEIVLGLYDTTSRAYLLWSFLHMPPEAFRVVTKNGTREYESITKEKQLPHVPYLTPKLPDIQNIQTHLRNYL